MVGGFAYAGSGVDAVDDFDIAGQLGGGDVGEIFVEFASDMFLDVG